MTKERTRVEELLDAVRGGSSAGVARLLDAYPELCRATTPEGVSVVLFALYHRQPELARQLAAGRNDLDAFEAAALGAEGRLAAALDEDPAAVNATAADGFTALHLAAYFDRPACVRRLLDSGASADTVADNAAGMRPLHSAVAARSIPCVKLLLAGDAPVDARQSGGWTALHSAALHGDEELVEVLLAAGADPTLEADDGRDAARLAESSGHAELAARVRAAASRD